MSERERESVCVCVCARALNTCPALRPKYHLDTGWSLLPARLLRRMQVSVTSIITCPASKTYCLDTGWSLSSAGQVAAQVKTKRERECVFIAKTERERKKRRTTVQACPVFLISLSLCLSVSVSLSPPLPPLTPSLCRSHSGAECSDRHIYHPPSCPRLSRP